MSRAQADALCEAIKRAKGSVDKDESAHLVAFISQIQWYGGHDQECLEALTKDSFCMAHRRKQQDYITWPTMMTADD